MEGGGWEDGRRREGGSLFKPSEVLMQIQRQGMLTKMIVTEVWALGSDFASSLPHPGKGNVSSLDR